MADYILCGGVKAAEMKNYFHGFTFSPGGSWGEEAPAAVPLVYGSDATSFSRTSL